MVYLLLLLCFPARMVYLLLLLCFPARMVYLLLLCFSEWYIFFCSCVSQLEWYISTVYHYRDIPFWSETLDFWASSFWVRFLLM